MPDEQLQANSQDVERIRDIIFGTQMRDYQQRFQVLQQDLARLQQEIDHLTQRLATQEQSQQERLEATHHEMRRATDDLRNELLETTQQLGTEKVERLDLGQLLLRIGTHLTEGRPLANLFEDLVAGE